MLYNFEAFPGKVTIGKKGKKQKKDTHKQKKDTYKFFYLKIWVSFFLSFFLLDMWPSERFCRIFNNPQQGANKITLFVLVWIVWGRGRQPLCQCLHQRLALRVAQ